MKGRLFKTTVEKPTDEMKNKIGDLICEIISPWVFKIVGLEKEELELNHKLTIRITGPLTQVGKKWLEELKKDE